MKSLVRKLIVLVGDWGGLYLALYLLTVVRYGNEWQENWDIHLRPFSLLFPLWIITLYGAYLYETRFFRFGINTIRAIGTAVAIALVGSITAFYIFPPGLIQPRRNMVIFAALYALVLVIWRWLFYKLFGKNIKTNLLFIGAGREVKELKDYFKENPHLGYTVKGVLEGPYGGVDMLREHIEREHVRLVVVRSKKGEQFAKSLFPILASGATVIELEEFYERVLGKVSPEVFTDLWFIKSLENINAEVYRLVKRAGDIAIGALGLIMCAFLFIPVALAIKIDSRGPVIFRQQRTGKNNRPFSMYKFRTMQALGPDGSAETDGPQWAREGDARITRVGNFLRKTRLDELPQFWNIVIGDMSFVGPRPERPEFVEGLARKIPYYNMRHLVRPGLTGWAQINFEYGDSVEDARVKLQYDIYYAKNRSIALDLAIMLKTVKIVITRQGQ